MLNEQRVKLMTKLSSYEAGDGKKNMSVGTYFRGDYIGKEVIKSIVFGTVAFCIMFAMYVVYGFESLMQDIYKMDLLDFGKSIAVLYLKFIAAYAVITYIVYAIRYKHSRRALRIYYNNLRRLLAMYKAEYPDIEEQEEIPVEKKTERKKESVKKKNTGAGAASRRK